MNTQEIPYGYCQCGCGQKTTIAKSTDRKYGHIKGEPKRFLFNHHFNIRSDTKRFWQKVAILSLDECWLWQGSLYADGYGSFATCKNGKYTHHRAHRFAYELTNGTIPDGLLALHKCDVRQCVNPNHIFVGTQQDNIDDMIKKGRDNLVRDCPGEKNPSAKLTDAKVLEIRRRQANGESQYALAKEFDVIQATISKIILRKNWRHI